MVIYVRKNNVTIKKITAIICAFSLLICCSCSFGGADTDPQNNASYIKNENSISIGVYNFDTYNPIATVSQSVTQTSALIYDSLVKRASDRSIQMCLCSGYTVSDSSLTYTFTLKDNVRWHDGSEFTAEDVEYTFEMIEALEQSAYKGRLSNVASYAKTGKNVFVVTLGYADSGFINLMDIPIIKSGTDCVNSLKEYIPIGTGPYKYVRSDLSRAIRLVRNEDYAVSQKPLIEQIIIKQLPDKDSLAGALEAREIEAAAFSASEMRNYNPKGNLTQIPYSNNTLTFVGINTTVDNLDKALLRRALSYTIDRDAIKKDVFFDRAQSVSVPIVPDSYLYNRIYDYARDTERAAKLLLDAGYTKGDDSMMQNADGEKLSFDLVVNMENELRVSTAQKIKNDLRQIGIDIRVIKLAFEDYTSCIDSGEYDMFLGEVKINKNLNLSAFAGSNASYSIYSTERIDALMRACRYAETNEEFITYYKEIAEVFLSEMPIIPLVMGCDALVLNSKIKGVTPPVESNIFSNIASWYIEK